MIYLISEDGYKENLYLNDYAQVSEIDPTDDQVRLENLNAITRVVAACAKETLGSVIKAVRIDYANNLVFFQSRYEWEELWEDRHFTMHLLGEGKDEDNDNKPADVLASHGDAAN